MEFDFDRHLDQFAKQNTQRLVCLTRRLWTKISPSQESLVLDTFLSKKFLFESLFWSEFFVFLGKESLGPLIVFKEKGWRQFQVMWDCLYRDFVKYLPYIESRNPSCVHKLVALYIGVKDAYVGSRPCMHP